MATSLGRARDRNDSARVPRSLDRLQRGLTPSNSQFVFRLLSPIENASFPGEGFAGATVGPAAPNGTSRGDPAGRRIAPSLRAARRLSYRHRSLTLGQVRPRGQVREAPASQLTEIVSGQTDWILRHRRNTLLPPCFEHGSSLRDAQSISGDST